MKSCQINFKLFLIINILNNIFCDIYPFQNISLPWDVRVNDLVSRLNSSEIIEQLIHGGVGSAGPAPAIPRLNIGPYSWNTECLRGDIEQYSTAFPQAIGLAASWNKYLVFEIANATAYEVRANYIEFQKKHQYGDHRGLSCFSPVINIMRHPLWGRNQETYGEDPYLTSVTAIYFVNGLQGNHPRYLITNAGCKHFDVHNGPENIPVSRFSFNANVSETDWRTTFLPQFKACVDAGTYNLMCSYNSINGVPACANNKLLTDIARNAFNFTGYIISDQGALENIYLAHKYVSNALDAAVAAITAGVNLALTNGIHSNVFTELPKALKENKITEDLLIERVKPLFYTRMRLGEFDPHDMNPYWNISYSIIQSQQHRNLALYATMQSFVLLKNYNQYLPLKSSNISSKKAAFIGPMCDNLKQQYGDYAPNVDNDFASTPFKSLNNLYKKSKLVPGCDSNKCSIYDSNAVSDAIDESDIIFLCVGTGQQCESEGNDRADMNFHGKQQNLFEDVIQKTTIDKDVIILLFNAGPLNINSAINASNVKAIIECFLPGQSGGEAIKHVLLNDMFGSNPAGRLPFTWPFSLNDVPPMTNYSMSQRTYRYSTAVPLFPFGYGLSYSIFKYISINLSSNSINAGDSVNVSVSLQNLGPYSGDEVVQIYVQYYLNLNFSVPHPIIQLVAYERVYLNLNDKIDLTFTITPEQLSVYYPDDEEFVVFPSYVTVYAGGNQPNLINKSLNSNILTASFSVDGYNPIGSYVSYATNVKNKF